MSEPGRAYWEAQEAWRTTRVLLGLRVSSLKGEHRRWLGNDLLDVRRAVGFVSESREVAWDLLDTSREMQAPSNVSTMTDDERVSQRRSIVQRNRSACGASDCLVEHGWNNGSTMLGVLQTAFLEGPIVRPVIVLQHTDNERVSLAWEGMQDEYPQLTFLSFTDDLVERLKECLERLAETIEASAVSRLALLKQYAPISEALTDSIRREDAGARQGIAASLGMSTTKLYSVVSDPMQLAALNSSCSDFLRSRYSLEIKGAIKNADVHQYFTEPEILAFRTWASGQPKDRATRVIDAELMARQSPGVFNPRPQLSTLDSWELLAARLGR